MTGAARFSGVLLSTAVQQSYGGPEGLARFVDAAHALGLAVVLDVVYNHFGPEANVLPQFGPYLTAAYRTPWGHAVNVAEAGSDGVRRTFVESAVRWIEDFHIDGLRLDAVGAIHDQTARPFLEELTEAVHTAGRSTGRGVIVIAESSGNDPRLITPVADGGIGCDAVWNDDLHHSLRVAMTGDRRGYYVDYDGVGDLAVALEHRWVFDDTTVLGLTSSWPDRGVAAGSVPHPVASTAQPAITNPPAGRSAPTVVGRRPNADGSRIWRKPPALFAAGREEYDRARLISTSRTSRGGGDLRAAMACDELVAGRSVAASWSRVRLRPDRPVARSPRRPAV